MTRKLDLPLRFNPDQFQRVYNPSPKDMEKINRTLERISQNPPSENKLEKFLQEQEDEESKIKALIEEEVKAFKRKKWRPCVYRVVFQGSNFQEEDVFLAWSHTQAIEYCEYLEAESRALEKFRRSKVGEKIKAGESWLHLKSIEILHSLDWVLDKPE